MDARCDEQDCRQGRSKEGDIEDDFVGPSHFAKGRLEGDGEEEGEQDHDPWNGGPEPLHQGTELVIHVV